MKLVKTRSYSWSADASQDAVEEETAASMESVLQKPTATTTTVPASPTGSANAALIVAKEPHVEIYGFIIYLGSFVCYAVFLLWAYLPEEVLQQIGITYYPSKWWALSLPLYVLVLALFVVVVFISHSLINTAPLDSIHTITDEHANVIANLGSQTFKHEEKVPELLDIPISVVNKCLFQGILEEELNIQQRVR